MGEPEVPPEQKWPNIPDDELDRYSDLFMEAYTDEQATAVFRRLASHGIHVMHSLFSAREKLRDSRAAEAALRARVEVLEAALRDAESGIVAALDALDNDRLAGQYLRSTKRQSVDNRSMHTELATVAMDSEKEARAALDRARAALSSSAPAATPQPDYKAEVMAARATQDIFDEWAAALEDPSHETPDRARADHLSREHRRIRAENERRESAAATPTTEEP